MQSEILFGTDEQMTSLMQKRKAGGVVWKVVFLFATSLAILFLLLLLVSVIDSTFGYVAVRNEVEPSQLVAGKDEVSEFSRAELETVLQEHLSSGILRRVIHEKPLEERTNADLIALSEQYVIKPSVVQTWLGRFLA